MAVANANRPGGKKNEQKRGVNAKSSSPGGGETNVVERKSAAEKKSSGNELPGSLTLGRPGTVCILGEEKKKSREEK